MALHLARTLGGTVLNADSVQVYADLAVLSSRPGPDDLGAAPHLLFGHVDGAETYSVGRWIAAVETAIRAVRAAGKRPILVGGTGLYFSALLAGLSDIPAIPEAVRARVRREAEAVPAETLHARLKARDPVAAARLRPTDPQRILRAMEVFEATGRSLTAFQAERAAPTLRPAEYHAFFLAPERSALNARIDARFDRMMGEGALAEAERLGSRRLDPALPVMRALGVPPLLDHLAGRLTLGEAIAAGKLQTRQYAKRQMTFGRHQLRTFQTVAPENAAETIGHVLAG